MKIKYSLNEFRDIAAWIDRTFPYVFAFFLKAWLKALEDMWIDAKVSAALNKAEADYRASEGPLTELYEPTYTSEPSEVDGLDIIAYSYDNQNTTTRAEDQE